MEDVLKISDSLMVENMVYVMAEHCRYSSLAVWKQILISLIELLKTYPDKISLVQYVNVQYVNIVNLEQN